MAFPVGGSPETASANPSKKVDYGIDKIKNATKDELSELKQKVEKSEAAGDLMSRIISEGERGLKEDLRELGISETDFEGYIEEFKTKMSEKMAQIEEDKIINSQEAQDLENFITERKNFPKLNEIIRQKTEEERKETMEGHGKWAKEIDEILVTVAGVFGWNIGEPHMRSKLYEAMNWLGGKLGITGLMKQADSGKKNAEKKVAEMTIDEVLKSIQQEDETSKAGWNHLAKLFPKNEFGTLTAVTENKLTFEKDNQAVEYTVGHDVVSGWYVERDGNKEAFSDRKTGVVAAARRLNQKIQNTPKDMRDTA